MAKGKRRKMGLAATAFMACGAAWAQQDLPSGPPAMPPLGTTVASPDAFLEKLFGRPVGWIIKATGDLNGDRRDDWAGVVQWDASGNHAQLFILLQQADGSFVFAERSLASDTYRSGVEDLRIDDHGALTVNYDNSCSAICHASIDVHYKFYKGAWTLVGSDELSINLETQVDTRYSTNYLTGRTVKEVMGKNDKVVSSTVGHTDEKPVLLHDVGLFGR